MDFTKGNEKIIGDRVDLISDRGNLLGDGNDLACDEDVLIADVNYDSDNFFVGVKGIPNDEKSPKQLEETQLPHQDTEDASSDSSSVSIYHSASPR